MLRNLILTLFALQCLQAFSQTATLFSDKAIDYSAVFQTAKTLKAAADLAQSLTEENPDSANEIEQAYLARIAEIRRK